MMSERGSVTLAVASALVALGFGALSVSVVIDGQFVIGLVAAIPAIIAAYVSLRNTKDLKEVRQLAADTHREVKTINAQSLAQLADSDESRRIGEKTTRGEELTEAEKSHIDSVDEAGKQINGKEGAK